MKRATVSLDGETITVHVQMTFRKRGGRKLVVTPDGSEWAPRPRVDNAMVKALALARAFRWRGMLDTGVHATLEEFTRAKGLAPSYVSILRLRRLAPDLVEAILDGWQPAELRLTDLLKGFPLCWSRQAIPFFRSGRGDLLCYRDGEAQLLVSKAKGFSGPCGCSEIWDMASKTCGRQDEPQLNG